MTLPVLNSTQRNRASGSLRPLRHIEAIMIDGRVPVDFERSASPDFIEAFAIGFTRSITEPTL